MNHFSAIQSIYHIKEHKTIQYHDTKRNKMEQNSTINGVMNTMPRSAHYGHYLNGFCVWLQELQEGWRGKRACRAGVEKKGMYKEKGEDDVIDLAEVRILFTVREFLFVFALIVFILFGLSFSVFYNFNLLVLFFPIVWSLLCS